MILVDFSSTMHRMISVAQKDVELQEDEKFITEDYIFFAMHLILQELYSTYQEHKNKFGTMVLCLDNASGGYWRKDVYPRYKSKRKNIKEVSPIKWDEVYVYINSLLDAIKEYLPWKVLSIKRAEADDIMLALARHYNSQEFILIQSPDKDMIQAQKNANSKVFQYSSLTKKWLAPENKHDDMEDWLLEHVCLGDSCDEVPRIVDETVFSENFLKYLKENNVLVDNPIDFKEKLTTEKKTQLLQNYNVYKTNKKGEETELDIYFKERLGLSTLKKKIEKIGGLEAFLDSHPTYRENYKRNYTLVMEEGIPVDIWNAILLDYKFAKEDLNIVEFEKFLDNNKLSQLKMTMAFDSKKELTANDFGW